MTSAARAYGAFAAVAAAVVVVDQATKWLVLHGFGLYEVRPVVPGLFNLTLVFNTGVAFGLLAGGGAWRRLFLLAVAVAALAAMAAVLGRRPGRSAPLLYGAALVAGGAAGNMVDRLRYGAVVDFLDFHLGAYHWPAFNAADSAITVGAALMAFHFLFREPR
ncbi:signal peptidase II [Dissulfurirhabdus thermomarina]|uniref:Lipoprotein signal peptidase n=1 Tax=Dissulfurirhabdus thermomarina TaxID=1765737 RepID=A0A6N9TMB9_DISTH|nr:signal peptidase II [Dissulfurirhabdus thermomarina]NDY41580.1 signal peptidase II [Dissulfurirhabdus thermomarina]NMX22365.1 lipoprotein signal peptidase [Dissulfurirhabdus thermomarina]